MLPFQARDGEGNLVAVKALSLQSMSDWKQLDLFQREANTLKQLQHPGIPQYVADFEEDTEKDRGYFLVQASLEQPRMPYMQLRCYLLLQRLPEQGLALSEVQRRCKAIMLCFVCSFVGVMVYSTPHMLLILHGSACLVLRHSLLSQIQVVFCNTLPDSLFLLIECKSQ